MRSVVWSFGWAAALGLVACGHTSRDVADGLAGSGAVQQGGGGGDGAVAAGGSGGAISQAGSGATGGSVQVDDACRTDQAAPSCVEGTCSTSYAARLRCPGRLDDLQSAGTAVLLARTTEVGRRTQLFDFNFEGGLVGADMFGPDQVTRVLGYGEDRVLTAEPGDAGVTVPQLGITFAGVTGPVGLRYEAATLSLLAHAAEDPKRAELWQKLPGAEPQRLWAYADAPQVMFVSGQAADTLAFHDDMITSDELAFLRTSSPITALMMFEVASAVARDATGAVWTPSGRAFGPALVSSTEGVQFTAGQMLPSLCRDPYVANNPDVCESAPTDTHAAEGALDATVIGDGHNVYAAYVMAQTQLRCDGGGSCLETLPCNCSYSSRIASVDSATLIVHNLDGKSLDSQVKLGPIGGSRVRVVGSASTPQGLILVVASQLDSEQEVTFDYLLMQPH